MFAAHSQNPLTTSCHHEQNKSLKPPFFWGSSLLRAGSYVASDCHKRDSANANRDSVVQYLRWYDFRVDGLGRCMHQIGPEGVELSLSRDTRYDLYVKRETIGRLW